MTDTPSNPNEIERDLAQTRARLDATIDALQQRLSPGEMVDQAIGYVKESGGGEFGRNLMLSVRDHPIPVALIGVGVAWLMLAGPRRDHDGAVRVADRRPDLRDGPDLGSRPSVPGLGGAPADRYAAVGPAGAGPRAGDNRYPMGSASPTRDHWEDAYLTDYGAYAGAAIEDLATKADQAGTAVPRDPGEDEASHQERMYAAKGGVLGLRRNADETAQGFRERVDAAVVAAAERYERVRAQMMDGGNGPATRGQSAMTNTNDRGRQAAGGAAGYAQSAADAAQSAAGTAADYARSAAQTAYDYGRSVADGAYGYGRTAAGAASDYGQAAWEGSADVGQGVWRHVRDNPLPYALVGAGLAWLWWSGRLGGRGGSGWGDHRSSYGAQDRYRAPAGQGRTAGYGSTGGSSSYGTSGSYGTQARGSVDNLADKAQTAGSAVQRAADEAEDAFHGRVYAAKGAVMGLAQSVGETLAAFRERVDRAIAAAADQYGRWRDQATSAAGSAAEGLSGYGQSAYGYGRAAAGSAYDYGSDAAGRARDAGGRAVGYLQEQPLILAAVGVAAGALLAMLFPPTRYEREAVGGLREDVQDRFADLAEGAVDSASRVARSVADAARESAQREGVADFGVGGAVQAARDTVHEAATRVRHVVEDTAQAGRQALEQELGGDNGSGTRGNGSSGQDKDDVEAKARNVGGATGGNDRRTSAS